MFKITEERGRVITARLEKKGDGDDKWRESDKTKFK